MPLGGVPLLECICWDHDRFGKDYLGEFDIALEDIFVDGQINKEVGNTPQPTQNSGVEDQTVDFDMRSLLGTPSSRNGYRTARRRTRKTVMYLARSCCNSHFRTQQAQMRRHQTHTRNSRRLYALVMMTTLLRFRRLTSMIWIVMRRRPMKPTTLRSQRLLKNAVEGFVWLA